MFDEDLKENTGLLSEDDAPYVEGLGMRTRSSSDRTATAAS